MLLRSNGHEVKVVRDGDEALRAFGAFNLDVLLPDLGMPQLSDYEVAQRLRRTTRQCCSLPSPVGDKVAIGPSQRRRASISISSSLSITMNSLARSCRTRNARVYRLHAPRALDRVNPHRVVRVRR